MNRSANDMFPRLGLREVAVLLLLVVGGVTALIVNAATAQQGPLRGPVAKRLAMSGGVYSISFPPRTPMARARAQVLRTFPSDTRLAGVYDAAACKAIIVRSNQLAKTRGMYPGFVDIEFLTRPKTAQGNFLFDRKNVDTALVTLLVSGTQTPSC